MNFISNIIRTFEKTIIVPKIIILNSHKVVENGRDIHYYYNNKEICNEKSKEHYHNNKEYFEQKRKEYYEEHKEELKIKNQLYVEKNKEKIKENNSKKMYCECGSIITKKSKHTNQTINEGTINT
jgi:hypothetical protein